MCDSCIPLLSIRPFCLALTGEAKEIKKKKNAFDNRAGARLVFNQSAHDEWIV
jgi:hypothetical protein